MCCERNGTSEMKRTRIVSGMIFVVGIVTAIWLAECAIMAESISLEEAVQTALLRNPEITEARRNAEAAFWQSEETKGALAPKITYEYTVTRLDSESFDRMNLGEQFEDSPVPIDSEAFGEYYNPSASHHISALVPLFNGGQLWNSYFLARASAGLSDRLLDDTEQRIAFQVKQSYMDVLRTEKLQELAESILEAGRGHLEMTISMLRQGTRTRSDKLRWEAYVVQREAELESARHAVTLAHSTFNHLLGTGAVNYKPVPIALKSYDPEIAEMAQVRTEKILEIQGMLYQEALNKNALVSASRSRLLMAEKEKSIVRGDFLPSVNFAADYGYRADGSAFPVEDTEWSIALNARISMFEGLSNRAAVRKAKAKKEAVEASLEQVKRELRVQIEKALSDVLSAARFVLAANRASERAEESLRVAQGLFKNELMSVTDLTDVEVSAETASIEQINAYYHYLTARAALAYAVGEPEENDLFVRILTETIRSSPDSENDPERNGQAME